MPDSIHTDCGKQFTQRLFQELSRILNIRLTDTTGYNPKGNGQVERMHRDLGEMFRAMVSEHPHTWEDVLPQALFALRTMDSCSTGTTPFQILFGRPAPHLSTSSSLHRNRNLGPRQSPSATRLTFATDSSRLTATFDRTYNGRFAGNRANTTKTGRR